MCALGTILLGCFPAYPQEPKLIESIQGADLYKTYCASCHGQDAKGGGPMAGSLKAAPADLTRIAIRNHGVFPTVRMQKMISGEDQPSSGHGTREMPVWGPIFSKVTRDVDLGRVRIDNLVRYLRSIQQTQAMPERRGLTHQFNELAR
jgi:mono/diheme cytochrome c family protein